MQNLAVRSLNKCCFTRTDNRVLVGLRFAMYLCDKLWHIDTLLLCPYIEGFVPFSFQILIRCVCFSYLVNLPCGSYI